MIAACVSGRVKGVVPCCRPNQTQAIQLLKPSESGENAARDMLSGVSGRVTEKRSTMWSPKSDTQATQLMKPSENGENTAQKERKSPDNKLHDQSRANKSAVEASFASSKDMWYAAYDKKSGRPYYIHKVTQQTVWTIPNLDVLSKPIYNQIRGISDSSVVSKQPGKKKQPGSTRDEKPQRYPEILSDFFKTQQAYYLEKWTCNSGKK